MSLLSGSNLLQLYKSCSFGYIVMSSCEIQICSKTPGGSRL